jgi:hypothetical protein
MAFPDLAANLIYTVLCLVPGFFTLQTATYLADVDPELSEFERSTWSLLGSGVTLSVSYFLYAVSMGLATGRVRLIRPIDLGWVDLVAAYPVLLFVALLLGYATALALDRLSRTARETRPETAR